MVLEVISGELLKSRGPETALRLFDMSRHHHMPLLLQHLRWLILVLLQTEGLRGSGRARPPFQPQKILEGYLSARNYQKKHATRKYSRCVGTIFQEEEHDAQACERSWLWLVAS